MCDLVENIKGDGDRGTNVLASGNVRIPHHKGLMLFEASYVSTWEFLKQSHETPSALCIYLCEFFFYFLGNLVHCLSSLDMFQNVSEPYGKYLGGK